MSIIDSQEKLVRNGVRTRTLAQKVALERIKQIRYDKMNTGYFWVQNERSIVIAHPIVPELEGKLPGEVDNEHRTALEKVMRLTDSVIARRSDDFLIYDWYNESTGSIGKKLSYIKYYETWRWVIGNGVFIDDINRDIDGLLSSLILIGILLTSGSVLLSIGYSVIVLRSRINTENVRRALEVSETAIRRRDEQLLMLFEVSPFAIIVVRNADDMIVYVNQSFVRLSGYITDEVINRSPVELRVQSEQDYNAVRHFATGNDGDRSELTWNVSGRMIAKDGEVKDVVYSSVIVNVEGEPCSAIMIVDITEEKRMQEQLHQTQKMDTVGHLAGGIAHDFNNMLAGILGSAEVIRLSIDESDKNDILEYVDVIINAAQRASELTSKLLTFSRGGKSVSTAIDVHEAIESAIMLLKRSIDKKIEIVENLIADKHMITGDPALIQNAFLNIALNANDAMPDGGTIVFSSSVINIDEKSAREHSLASGGKYIEIRISDTGTGIPKEILPKIFDPFFTTKPVGKGTGLGLPAVYGTVKAHKGFITVHSDEGTGTEFVLCLPLDESVSALDYENNREIRSGKGCVLVVDDESIIRNTAFGMLSSMGYDVVLAEDGEAAIEIYKKERNRIDLVLLDMVMPKISGKETFDRLVSINPSVKVIFSSGFNPEGSYSEAMLKKAKGFIQKPYRIADLSIAISAALS